MEEEAAIGKIVLFNTGDGDRPMLILRVWNDDVVNGRVFLDGWNDKSITSFGVRIGDDLWVTSVARGSGVHQWRFSNGRSEV